jgi:hypothetical protein
MADPTIDLAEPCFREVWFSHPAVGDPSYDAFVRFAGNPVYQGSPPYEWPVNGTLFKDPGTGNFYCYVSLYPKGYWPAGPTKLLRSRDAAQTWEDLGLVLQGDKDAFDGDGVRAGATCDASVAADADGYHMAYGWAKPDNSDGGIAYAFSRSPEGPFVRDPKPIHAESMQPLLTPGYKRVYASSILRRRHDWMILASMSTPGNAGGMWAFIGMTAPEARGPYSGPVFLRSPQQGYWQPQPIEFFPAFVHEGYVYAPLTSVAANRGYQVIYRAPLEEAHRLEAWSVWQSGSAFHAESNPWEAHGIWGQAFAGLVDSEGRFRVLYPSRNSDGVGTINLASRPWSQPYTQGFRISGPNAPALALALRSYEHFRLQTSFHADGDWRLVWNCQGPLGPDRASADARISPLTWRNMTMFSVRGGAWLLEDISARGDRQVLAKGMLSRVSDYTVALDQTAGRAAIDVNGTLLCAATVATPGGALGLIAEQGVCLHVRRFVLDGRGAAASWFLLPLEGLVGAGNKERDWAPREAGFRYETGYTASFEGARAKWSFHGQRVRLWSPRGPDFGEAEVCLDGASTGRVSLHSEQPRESAAVWESNALSPGPHALMLVRVSGTLPVDCAEFYP